MRRPKIRTGYVLPHEAIVVRGGRMARSDLEKDAETAFEVWGLYGISVLAADATDYVDVLRYRDVIAKAWDVVMVTTAGRIRAHRLGFILTPTSRFPHYTLEVPRASDTAFEALTSLFEEYPNPLYIEPDE